MPLKVGSNFNKTYSYISKVIPMSTIWGSLDQPKGQESEKKWHLIQDLWWVGDWHCMVKAKQMSMHLNETLHWLDTTIICIQHLTFL